MSRLRLQVKQLANLFVELDLTDSDRFKGVFTTQRSEESGLVCLMRLRG